MGKGEGVGGREGMDEGVGGWGEGCTGKVGGRVRARG